MTTYSKPKKMMHSLKDIDDELGLQAKIVFQLQHTISLYTIPQLAKRLNASEDRIAKALYALCLVSMPRILILDNGETYFKKAVALANIDELPEFTSETQFYHLWTR